MQKFLVLFDVTVEGGNSTKARIAKLLGIKLSQLSIEFKSPEKAIYRVEADCERSKPIIDHVKSILDKCDPKYIMEPNNAIKSILFDIGVMHDTYSCSIVISNKCLKMIYDMFPDADIRIACYPTQFSTDKT